MDEDDTSLRETFGETNESFGVLSSCGSCCARDSSIGREYLLTGNRVRALLRTHPTQATWTRETGSPWLLRRAAISNEG